MRSSWRENTPIVIRKSEGICVQATMQETLLALHVMQCDICQSPCHVMSLPTQRVLWVICHHLMCHVYLFPKVTPCPLARSGSPNDLHVKSLGGGNLMTACYSVVSSNGRGNRLTIVRGIITNCLNL